MKLQINYFFDNSQYTTTEIRAILKQMANVIRPIKYVPIDIDIVGLPYLEAGDAINIEMGESNKIKSYIFRRNLKGIQALKDNLTSN